MTEVPSSVRSTRLHPLIPGVLLAIAVAVPSFFSAPLIAKIFPLPVIVIALLIGIALHPATNRPLFTPGLKFCVSKMLRWAVALLGLRVSLAEIADLGAMTALIVIVSMAITIVAGIALAQSLGLKREFGALAGAGTAVCGASATLATATVIPPYEGKEADIVFVVVAVNALSTVAMLLYPLIATALDFDPQTTGILLGGTIHDVAQVVGAGYAVSEPVGNTAVIVKLFRVLLLLPVVVGIGYWLSHTGGEAAKAKVPVPVFALFFLAFCILNSVIVLSPSFNAAYQPIKNALVTISGWGLLVAIAALGLGTSIAALRKVGWPHLLTITVTTLVILAVVTAGLSAT